MIKIIAIVGPTATGKTTLSIKLAKARCGEIVSCDSMQIYKGLDIGTAKPTSAERNDVPHHLIGFLDVDKDFSVADYVSLAEREIEEIAARGKLPILTGGTGLYARSLLVGSRFEENSRSEEIRARLEEEVKELGNEALHARLAKIDAFSSKHIHANNTKRLLRALEYFEVTGEPISSQAARTKAAESKYTYKMFCLTYKDREKLYSRINKRVDLMIDKGLIDEARAFHDFLSKHKISSTAAQAIGYKELFPYFESEITLDKAIENIKQGTRNYAKRQLTWFRKEENIDFICVDEFADENEMSEFCLEEADKFLKAE